MICFSYLTEWRISYPLFNLLSLFGKTFIYWQESNFRRIDSSPVILPLLQIKIGQMRILLFIVVFAERRCRRFCRSFDRSGARFRIIAMLLRRSCCWKLSCRCRCWSRRLDAESASFETHEAFELVTDVGLAEVVAEVESFTTKRRKIDQNCWFVVKLANRPIRKEKYGKNQFSRVDRP